MIRFERVSRRFGSGQAALSDVSLHIKPGEMVFLTGHSGAGKTTMLRLTALLDRATGGQVIVNNRNLRKIRRRGMPAHRRGLGMIFQDHRLLKDKTVFDNVALPMVINGERFSDIRKRVRFALDKVGLPHKEKSYPLMLSAGEQQRVGIARAIVNAPPLLLADEPTGNLDPQLSADLMDLFVRLNEAGTTVLIASHDLPLVRRLGKRVLVLQAGSLVDDISARLPQDSLDKGEML